MDSQKQNPLAAADKFRGIAGRERLLTAISEQFIVGHDTGLAARLLKKAEIRTFSAGECLMDQGGEDTHLMLILAGTSAVVINGRAIATRSAGDHVGEMALIDSYAKRSATVKATAATTVAIISEYDFNKIANRHVQLWRRLALSLGNRLRERSKFHPPPREKPTVFIASSSEGLPLAECIYEALRRSPTIPHLWSDGVFEAGKTTIEDLLREANESDFAIIIATKDDVTISRSRKKPSPRDNVIFELGLFMGALSRERTLLLAPKNVDLKIPSDLLGMTLIRYSYRKRARVGPLLRSPLKIIRAKIGKYGPR